MNFRTSHLAGLLASALLVLSSTSGLLSAAEPLNITGPDGENRQTLRQYGPTTASDTFWSIAQKSRPDASVTIYQVMAAIFEANPHAFASDNYNSLEKGMILLIPSKEVMLAIPKSLAKQQAENNDKGWRKQPQTAAKPKSVATTPEPQASQPQASQPAPVQTSTAQTDKPSAAQQNQIEELTAKLEAEQAKNLSLTDELARAQDKLNLGNNDSEMLQAKIDEQDTRIAELEEALLVQKEQKAQLSSELEQLRQQLAAATMPAQQKEVDDSWRTMMSSPLYIGLAAAIPALLLLVLVWLFIKRRNSKNEAVESSEPQTPPMDDKPVAPAPEDSEEMMAVHLDNDEEADSLDSLMNVDETQLKPEADLSEELPQEAAEMVVDSGDEQVMSPVEDEGQSLDDLWAEAMGEQEQEETQATQEDDLDSLLAELDTPAETPVEELSVEAAPEVGESTGSETDLDELLAEFEQETAEEEAKEEDLDALLAEFDLPADSEVKVEAEEAVDEPGQEADIAATDQVLVEDEKPQEAQVAEDKSDENDLADEIAHELEDAIDEKGDEGAVDDADLDALLAGFDAESAPETAQAPEVESDQQEEEVARQIAAELDDEDSDEVEEADLDALLAGFEAEAPASAPEAEAAADEASDTQVEAETQEEEPEPELDAALEAAHQEERPSTGHAPLEFDLGDDKPEAEVEEAQAEDDSEVDLDALLADLESVEESEEPKVEKGESGFFGDLKGNKRSSDNVLEWESALTNDAPSVEETPAEDDDEGISLQLDDDDNITVDEALAALDAAENKRPDRAVAEHDLTAFQQDNGFIDIDRLLNEADEEQLDVDKYKELDVDMGELDNLMGNAAMVDVDDEENAVNAKLDLARAYIEIDDMDSAKALLKEVELDGNERQQQEAKKLLDEL
ncbi:hypothetical protein L1D29_12405 [Shewanella insulae]|uniref:FimV/HubP family polar landmark protein n=1 Tax=Shewanella insulae TaxID=2681496 RepID=UPI001EFEEC56|nr:FimV/HubP family polar landmark protein [Shewanella insulae]MCG9713618.1 hypothetical protein [Shewanella insulae]